MGPWIRAQAWSALGTSRFVVADDAHVGERQRLDEVQVALVPLDGAGAGEIAEIGEEHRLRSKPCGLP
jgi:hypothetical protein